MSSFRKFITFVCFLAFVLAVGALAGSWFGVEPIATIMDACRREPWFNWILLALLAIVCLWLVVVLVRTLATRNKKTYQETDNDLGSVLISRDTIEGVAQETVDRHPELKALKVKARLVNRRKPYADLTAKVAPRGLVSLATVAPILQKEIKDSVETLTGNEVRSVVVDIRKNKNPEDVMTEAEEKQMNASIEAFEKKESLKSGKEAPAIEPSEDAPSSEKPKKLSRKEKKALKAKQSDSQETQTDAAKQIEGHGEQSEKPAAAEQASAPDAAANDKQSASGKAETATSEAQEDEAINDGKNTGRSDNDSVKTTDHVTDSADASETNDDKGQDSAKESTASAKDPAEGEPQGDQSSKAESVSAGSAAADVKAQSDDSASDSSASAQPSDEAKGEQ